MIFATLQITCIVSVSIIIYLHLGWVTYENHIMKYQVQKNMRVKVTLAVSWPLGSRKDVRAEHVLKV